MADTNQITKIYDLRTSGYETTLNQFNNLYTALEKVSQAKRDLNKAIQEGSRTNKEETDEVKAKKQAYQDAIAQEIELKTQIKNKSNELKAAQLVRQQELNLQKASIEGNKAEAGSYTATAKARAALYALVKPANQNSIIDFEGQALSFDQAIAKLKELSAAEQAFRRQFQQDGTLVGEYTTGIVQAFKKMGLDDLVKGQVTRANERLKELNGSFESLKGELSSLKVSGAGGFEALEKQLIENRKEAIELNKQIGHLKTELRGVGDIGNQITTGIAAGFKSAKGQIAQLVLSYVGFQAIFQGIITGFQETVRLDSLTTALSNVSQSESEFAINQAFLARTTKQLGLVLLDSTAAFKNFYAAATQAGISADKTRDIFFAASAASANLKLSQEDTNGVLLAFGQIASKGTVQAEELRGQIGERIPGAFSIAAKAIGVTQQELNKMLQNGQVLSTEFLPKFAAELQKTFGGDTSKQVTGLQASINRLKNEFTALIAGNKAGITAFVSAIISIGGGILSVIGVLTSIPFPFLIAGISAVTGAFALYRAEQIRSYLVTQIASQQGIIYNAFLALQAVRTRIVSLLTRAATAEIVLFNGAIRVSPLGIFLTILGAIIPAIAVFASRLKDAKSQISALNEVQKKANDAIAEQVAKIDGLVAAAKNLSISYDTRKKAIQDLIAINPEFQKGLKDEVIVLDELDKAYKRVTEGIKLKANAEAAESLAADRKKNVLVQTQLRQQLEIGLSNAKGGNLDDILDAAGISRSELDEINGLIRKNLLLTKDAQGQARTSKNIEDKFIVGDLIKVIRNKENDATKEYQLFLDLQAKNIANLNDYENRLLKENQSLLDKRAAKNDLTIEELEKQIQGIDAEIKKLKEFDPKIKELQAKKADLQKRLDAALGTKLKGGNTSGSRLTGDQRDRFKEADAERDRDLAAEKLRFAEKRSDEEIFLKNSQVINRVAIDKKLQLLTGANAEEKKQMAELQLEKINLQVETDKKLFDLQEKQLKERFEQQKLAAQQNADKVLNDPLATGIQRTQAKLTFDEENLKAQEKYFLGLDALEKKYNEAASQNANQRKQVLRGINNEILQGNIKLSLATLQEIKEAGERQIREHRIFFGNLRKAILDNDQLTEAERKRQLDELTKAETRTILSDELATLNIEVKKKKELLDLSLIDNDEYQKAVEAQTKKAAEVSANDSSSKSKNLDSGDGGIKDFINNISNLFRSKAKPAIDQFNEEIGNSGISFGFVMSESFGIAKDAMNGYFDAQRQRIEESKKLQLDRLQLEQDQLKQRAQSKAEEASIDRQYELKRQAIQKEAGEKLKKQKRAEVYLSLATEIAGIAASAAKNPSNAITFGAAGLAQFAILSALALAKAALNISMINRQQFAFGGDVPTRGGRFGGKPHSQGGTPFGFQNQWFDAEAKELAIIRTKNAPANKPYTISGTHTQIASMLNRLGGGIDFEPGAKLKKFAYGGSVLAGDYRGNLGESLQAPVFTPSSRSGTINSTEVLDAIKTQSEDLKAMTKTMQEQTKAINGRIDRLEVYQVTQSVTDAQKKALHQRNTGTL